MPFKLNARQSFEPHALQVKRYPHLKHNEWHFNQNELLIMEHNSRKMENLPNSTIEWMPSLYSAAVPSPVPRQVQSGWCTQLSSPSGAGIPSPSRWTWCTWGWAWSGRSRAQNVPQRCQLLWPLSSQSVPKPTSCLSEEATVGKVKGQFNIHVFMKFIEPELYSAIQQKVHCTWAGTLL